MTRQAVRLASGLAEEVEFSAEDATRSNVDYLCEVFAIAVEEGASILNVRTQWVTPCPPSFRDWCELFANAS